MKYFLLLIVVAGTTIFHFSILWAQTSLDAAVAVSEMVDVLDVQNLSLAETCAELTVQTGFIVTADPQLKKDISLYIENASIEDILQIMADDGAMAYVSGVESGLQTFEIVSRETYRKLRGRSFSQNRVSRILTMSYAKPSDVIRRLEHVKSFDGRMFGYDGKKSLIVIDHPEKVTDMLKVIEKFDVPTEMRTFEFYNASAEQLLPRIEALLSEYTGQAEMHQAAKRVTVTDTPEKLGQIDQLIKFIDNENRSINMDVKVLQIVLSDEYAKGVDWPAIVVNYKNMKFSPKADGDLAENFSVGTVSGEDFQVLLDSLDAVGIVQEIQHETLTVKNGSSADVMVKSVDLVLRSSDAEDVQRVEHRDAIGFELTAGMEDRQHFLLNLIPRVSSYKERIWLDQFYTRSVARDFMPSKDKGAVEVTVGETLVVGGLFKNVTVESTHAIPFLGKIPLLGFAFRNQGREVRKAEMILFLTPRPAQDE